MLALCLLAMRPNKSVFYDTIPENDIFTLVRWDRVDPDGGFICLWPVLHDFHLCGRLAASDSGAGSERFHRSATERGDGWRGQPVFRRRQLRFQAGPERRTHPRRGKLAGRVLGRLT